MLGLPAHTTDPRAIRAAFLARARLLHPDRCLPPLGTDHAAPGEKAADADAAAAAAAAAGAGTEKAVGGGAGSAGVTGFEAVREAYEHLTRRGGAGAQSNPSHCLHTMLQAAAGAGGAGGGSVAHAAGGGGGGGGGGEAVRGAAADAAENARFFKARLVATVHVRPRPNPDPNPNPNPNPSQVHEYGEAGLPVDSLRRKFAQVPCQPSPKARPELRSPQPDRQPDPRCPSPWQVWRGHEVPPPSAFGLPPRTPLNKVRARVRVRVS